MKRRDVLGAGAATIVVAACGGGDGYGGSSGGGSRGGTGYRDVHLVSDTMGSGPYGNVNYGDTNLVNAWGLVMVPGGEAWVANAGTSRLTHYDGNGIAGAPVVTTPASPTGIVFNAGSEFVVGAAPAVLIVATEGGQIAGVPAGAAAAVTAHDGSPRQASYKGLAIGTQAGAPAGASRLYAADFHNGRVDVFDGAFALLSLPATAFVDPALPAGYAPYGIQAVGSSIVVAYALQDAARVDEVKGAGLGVVNVFDMDGTLLRRLVSPGGALDAPWGIAMAPASGFGALSGALLVGNFGDGRINGYDFTTGALVGTVNNSGTPIAIDGLWGIAFGNGANAQPATHLFYAAGPADEAHGAYGKIQPIA